MMEREGREDRNPMRGVVPYLDLGLRFALSIVLGVYLGYWLDSKLSTTPLFILLGLALGATSGFLTIYRAAFPAKKNGENGKD